ncbi:hypothetical protein N7491_011041 [Penicillium cf. griseofulvum]|uniref:Uncharacterized protein n=1 Tax=Penicillium cf. griseofulvum TaxID=2972120 RepID=A0A9W9T6L2_9EURO|nr:hypothetical protein N7472_001360 [Penicillium cf. griseofulvum]KAJ5422596.1 hypothetical protein N7491_011041 [Penicillium cf. griseofulvum]KAJ5428773.1 hypothetical protein N7445_010227 [Penicillium cf. griseofulvum]
MRKGMIGIDGVDICRLDRCVLRSTYHAIAQDTDLQRRLSESHWLSKGFAATIKDVTFSSVKAQLCSLTFAITELAQVVSFFSMKQ